MNPCCQPWKEKYSKLEGKRNALRKAVNILQPLVEKLQAENISLKKAYEEEKTHADTLKEGREKEAATRISLENELSSLKSEISLLQPKVGTDASHTNEQVSLLQIRITEGEKEINRLKELVEKEKRRADLEKKSAETERMKAVEAVKNLKAEKVKDEEMKLLQAHVSEREKEISQLKELVEKEKLRADAEKRSAEVEKRKAVEAWKYVKAEKGKANEERRLSQLDGKKAEDYRIQVEALRNEANETKSKLVYETSKFEEVNKKLEAEKQKTIKERKRANSEMAKAEVQRKLAEANRKKAEEEKSRAERVSQQLEEATREIEELKKEIDKQKAISKKKNVELDMVRVEEQERLVKMARKKAMEEKHHADYLSQQLKEARLKIEDLQKQIDELLSSREVVGASAILPNKQINAVISKAKNLKKELKLKKMRVKHAKQVAKLERSRNDVLQEEIGSLKLELVQFSRRLNLLDKCFLPCTEGINDWEKVGDFRNMQLSKLKEKLCCLEPFQLHLQSENELLKPNCKAAAASYPLGKTLQQSARLASTSGGTHTEAFTGIDSELDSLIGGSNRKLLQSSAINSSTASFSDKGLVGSQGRGAVSVTTSAKIVEENFNVQPTTSSMNGEKMTQNEDLVLVAENSVRSPHNDVIGRNGHSKKRKRILDAVESIGFLYSEDKKLHLQIEEKLSDLHGMLLRNAEKFLEETKSAAPNLQGNSLAEHDRVYKKRKASSKEKVVIGHLHDLTVSKKMEKLKTIVCEDSSIFGEGFQPEKNLTGTALPERICDSDTSVPEARIFFGQVANGRYMKLLDLDNAADEESYRKAMEMPLSPTLPDIECRGFEAFDLENFKPLVERSSRESFCNKKEDLPPSRSFDVINMEMALNKLKYNVSEPSNSSLMHKDEGALGSFDVLGTNGSGLHNTIQAGNNFVGHTENSRKPITPSSKDDEVKIPFEGELGSEHNSIPEHCVVFSTIKEPSSISRIFHATKSCMDLCSLVAQTQWVVGKILLALKMKESLLVQEKVCVFFSLLMLNFSMVAGGKSGSFLNCNFVSYLDSFAGHMREVISDTEAGSIFADLLDNLLSLIEDFLLDGRVVYADASSKTLLGCDVVISVPLDGINVVMSNRVASADQLVAGSIILASICAAADRIGFVWEVSCNIFSVHRYDTSVLLTVVHVFAHLGGKNFFNLRMYALPMIVLKSIIMFLESRHVADTMDSCYSSASEIQADFHPCSKCPFSEGAVSMDVVVSLLLGTLQNYAQSGTIHDSLINSPESNVIAHMDKSSLRCEDDHCVFDMNCDASCWLYKCGIHATGSETVSGGTLCHFSDVLSLVELLASNMSWDWICENIVGSLLKMLELPVAENFSVAIVILLGQLGRLGVEAGGYEDRGVEDLRGKLSAFLWKDTTIRAGLPVQIATVNALVRLLSLDFEEVVQSKVTRPAIASQSVPTELIRKWFSLLREEQRAFSFSVLHSAS